MKIAAYACALISLASTGCGWLAPHAESQSSAQTAANQVLQATMQADGSYALVFPGGGWKLEGKLGGPFSDLKQTSGTDRIGFFHQISGSFLGGKRTAEIRVYENHPIVLFRDNWKAAGVNEASFPTFDSLPQDTYRVSFQKSDFGVYEFGKLGLEGPWTFFDKQNNAMTLSPADHFPISTMEEKPGGTATSGIVSAVQQLPAGFTHGTLIAAGSGINHVFSVWGSALLSLGGKQRTANNADVTLAKLGYWTDNKTAYYYKFEPKLGYTGTLLAVRDEFKKLDVPLGYMQLDSWFYPKGLQWGWMYGTATPEWGENEYRAHKALFPQGLSAFQRELGLPLVTHARWVSSQSPYHQEFKMSGNAVIDPRFWKQTADYLHEAGVVGYEQDWLSSLAKTDVNLTDPPLYLGGMARSMADRNITIQYCTPLPSDYMVSTLYPNVQTIRPSGDGFGHDEWDNFLFDSRLASAVGLWPWTDAPFSKDMGDLVLATLSAGPVGVGDAIGQVNVRNLLAVVRKDGTIIKPDTSLIPIDALYQHDAAGEQFPMIASAATTFGNLKIQYVFAYPRQDSDRQVTVTLRELGVSDPVFAYDWVTHKGQLIPPDGSFTLEFADGWAYQVLAPVTPSGLALLGNTDKITPLGRALIAGMSEDGDSLSATIRFASGERAQTIYGYAARRPTIKAVSGSATDITYSEESHIFTTEVAPDKSGVARIQILAE